MNKKELWVSDDMKNFLKMYGRFIKNVTKRNWIFKKNNDAWMVKK